MSKNKQPATGRDDFQKIKGIGEVTARALYDQGIQTYGELAQYTTTRLEELLKGKISALSLRRIAKDDWPGQARLLVNGTARSADQPQTHRETWRELADFFISFGYAIDDQGKEHLQTKVHHSQADKLQQWDGIASDQLIAWMLKQANLPKTARGESIRKTGVSSGEIEPPEAGNIIQMSLSDVWVNEVSTPSDSTPDGTKTILRIESQLTLPDEIALNQAFDRAPYAVENYLVDVQTNQSKLVNAYTDHLSAGIQSYQITQDINIPDAGRYQLILFARLLPPLIGIAQAQGPLIRVEV